MEELPNAPKEPAKTIKIGKHIEELVYRHTYHEADGTKVMREIYTQKKARNATPPSNTRSDWIKKVTDLGLNLKISPYLADDIVRRLKRITAKRRSGITPLKIDRFKLDNFRCNIFTYIRQDKLFDLLIEKKAELKLTDNDAEWINGKKKETNVSIKWEIERAMKVRELTTEQICEMIKAGKDPNAE